MPAPVYFYGKGDVVFCAGGSKDVLIFSLDQVQRVWWQVQQKFPGLTFTKHVRKTNCSSLHTRCTCLQETAYYYCEQPEESEKNAYPVKTRKYLYKQL